MFSLSSPRTAAARAPLSQFSAGADAQGDWLTPPRPHHSLASRWSLGCCSMAPLAPIPGLLLHLLLQLCDLGLQGRDGGLELGLDCPLHLLQLAPQLLVLPLKLLPRILILLGCTALRGQLVAELLCLGRRVEVTRWRAPGSPPPSPPAPSPSLAVLQGSAKGQPFQATSQCHAGSTTGPQCPSWRGAHCREVGAKEKAGRRPPGPSGRASSAGGSHYGRPCRPGARVTREEGVGAPERMCWVPTLLPCPAPCPGLAHRSLSQLLS